MQFLRNLRDTHPILRWYTPHVLAVSSLLALSSLAYGIDVAVYGGMITMDSFVKQFGEQRSNGALALPTYYLSLFNSLQSTGQLAGVVLGSMLSDRIGRKRTLTVMCMVMLISVVILCTSYNRWQILVGRILSYVYVGAELSVIILYQSEVVPAAVRGLAVSSYHILQLCGGVLISSILRGCQIHLTGSVQWRMPLALIAIPPILVLTSSLTWLPESPRWLLLRGRNEEAKAVLNWLHASRDDFDLEKEFEIMREAVAAEPESGAYKELFKGSNKRRTAITFSEWFFFQATGQSFATLYGGIFVKSLNLMNALDFNMLRDGTCLVGTIFTALYVDRWMGRKWLQLWGSVSICLAYYTMGGLGVQTPMTEDRARGIIFSVIWMALSFNMSWATTTFVVASELPALHLRDKTQRIGGAIAVIVNFAISFSLAYALRAMQSKVGFIYGTMAVFAAIFTYFCVPDCQGRSLEEVNYMFQNSVPVSKFKTYTDDTVRYMHSTPAVPLESHDGTESPTKDGV